MQDPRGLILVKGLRNQRNEVQEALRFRQTGKCRAAALRPFRKIVRDIDDGAVCAFMTSVWAGRVTGLPLFLKVLRGVVQTRWS